MKESFQIKIAEWDLSNKSCMRCGGDLTKYSLCAICKHAMQHICLQCGFRSEAGLHRCHLESDGYQTRISMIENMQTILA